MSGPLKCPAVTWLTLPPCQSRREIQPPQKGAASRKLPGRTMPAVDTPAELCPVGLSPSPPSAFPLPYAQGGSREEPVVQDCLRRSRGVGPNV